MTHPLLELGVHRLECPVPFPQAGGPANVYVIDEADGGVALFDSGLGTLEGETAVREGFARLGRRFGDVRRIFLSHGHIDHYGLARTISEESGAPVFIHERDRLKVERPDAEFSAARDATEEYLRRLGVDAAELGRLFRGYERQLAMARPVEHTRPLRDGDRLDFARFSVRVDHCPGHTPGLVCLVNDERRLLFSDDHLLERISPNPLVEVGPEGDAHKFRALPSYLATLEKTRALAVDLVLPGHGPPFHGPRRIIDGLLGFYGKRQAKLLVRLAAGPATAVELVGHVFPRAGRGELFLTLSEVVGNLEVLEDRGQVVRLSAAPLYRWALAEGAARAVGAG